MIAEKSEISHQIDILMFLKDSTRRGILEMLYDAGPRGASFKMIKERLGIPPTSLAYHLKIMIKEGAVEKDFKNVEGRRDYSYYSLTGSAEKGYPRALSFLGSHIDERSGTEVEGAEIRIIPLRLGPRVIKIEGI